MLPFERFELPPDFPVVCFDATARSLRGAHRGAHRHSSCELTLVRRGTTQYSTGGHHLRVRPGDAILFAPHQPHEWQEQEGGEAHKTVVLFDASVLQPVRPVVGGHVGDREEIVALIDRIREELSARRAGYPTVVRAALERIVVILESEGPHTTEVVARGCRLLRERFREPWTVPTVAAELGMSRSRFSVLFRHETGTTVKRFLRQLRVVQAERLLRETSCPVDEVAERAGFGSISALERAFRTLHGGSPRDIRRRGNRFPAPACDDE